MGAGESKIAIITDLGIGGTTLYRDLAKRN
ncbi:hypothetical protein [Corynebacterium lubricantis]